VTAELAIEGRASCSRGDERSRRPARSPETRRVRPAAVVQIALEGALHDRPELAARDAVVAREATGARLAEKGYLPDFEVSVGRFLNADAPNGFGAMASMTIPLVWKGKYDAGVAEAKARMLSAEADRRRAADDVRRDVEQAYLRARTALVLHDLFAGTHVPHADQALRVTEASYVGGTADLTMLLETVRNVERVHLEHVVAAANFERAWADLERAVGADLPRTVPSTRRRHRHDRLAAALLAFALLAACDRAAPPPHDHQAAAPAQGVLYQCPMHPQIIRTEPGACPICGMPLQRVDDAGHATLPAPGHAAVVITPERQQLIGVTRAVAEVRPLVRDVRAAATVANDPALYEALIEYREGPRALARPAATLPRNRASAARASANASGGSATRSDLILPAWRSSTRVSRRTCPSVLPARRHIDPHPADGATWSWSTDGHAESKPPGPVSTPEANLGARSHRHLRVGW
jgi:hypothetical protein